tara:strand:- start:469 stop:4143 length:3675 start_codon:yes stop_codon:yes gene_type:complete
MAKNLALKSHTIIMNSKSLFTNNQKVKFSKIGLKYFKQNYDNISVRVSKAMKGAKFVFNPFTRRTIKLSSYNKPATQRRISKKYFDGMPTYLYGGVITSRGRTKYSVVKVNTLGYSIYNVKLENSIDDKTILEDTLFHFIQSKVNPTQAYRISIKLRGEGSLGFVNLNSKSNFKWRKYQTLSRFIKFVARGITRLDNGLLSQTPDAGEENEDENQTYLETFPAKNIKIAILPEEFIGGCYKEGSYKKSIVNNCLVNDYKSTGNNCLFVVVRKFLRNKIPKSNKLREVLGLEKGKLVSSDIIHQLAILAKCNLKLYYFDDNKNLILHSETEEVEDWKTCHILYENNHYRHIINLDYKNRKIKCKRCNVKIIESNMGKHICNAGNITYVNRYLMKDRMGKSKMRTYQETFDTKKFGKNAKKKTGKKKKEKKKDAEYPINNLVYDFETFPLETNGEEIVYAVGMYWVEADDYRTFYGENALEDFMNFIYFMNEKNIGFNLISYNGSGYDHYFIYHYCLEKEVEFPQQPLMNGGRILQIAFWKNRSFDLYLFTAPNSLDGCLKGFKVKEIAKGVFPHNYPSKWADVYYKGAGLERKMYPKSMLKKIDDDKLPWAFIPEYFDFKEECLLYLKSDVMGLYQVYDKMRLELLKVTGVDFRSYLTISQMSYDFNCSLLGINDYAELPQDKSVYDVIDRSIYGGRTKPVKLRFENKFLTKSFLDCKGDQKKLKKLVKKITKKRKEFEVEAKLNPENIIPLMEKYKKWEYIVPFDVKSLYPTTYDMPFPSGKSFLMDGKEYWQNIEQYLLKGADGKYRRIYYDKKEQPQHIISDYAWGIYIVDIVFIPKHIIPVLPQKNEKGHTCWDLVCRENQHYTTIDLEEGIAKGYRFTIKKALVYKSAKCFLAPFVKKVYAIKKQEDVYKNSDDEAIRQKYNPAKRMSIKIMLNALYGKMIQRPILECNVIVDSFKKSEKFHKEYDWVSWDIVGKEKMLLTGIKREFKGSCSKPIQIGSFILSYSRVIMREYMDLCDPYRFTDMEKSMKMSFYYTDTDCLWISSFQQHLLEHRIGEELGDVEDELEGGFCFDAYFICPKVYLARYYIPQRDGSIKLKVKMRAKGHPSYCLKPEYYKFVWETGSIQTDEFVMLKKIRWKLTKNEENEGLTAISIKKLDCRRRLNRDTWVGRTKLKNGDTYPIGYFDEEEMSQVNLFGTQEELDCEDENPFLELGQLTDTPI